MSGVTVLGLRIPLILNWFATSYAGNGVRFFPLFGSSNEQTIELITQISLPFDFHAQRVQCRVDANAKDGNTPVTLRDDGVSVAPNLTIPAGVSGLINSSTVNIIILRDSLLSIQIDTSTSTVGNLGIRSAHILGYVRQEDLGPVVP